MRSKALAVSAPSALGPLADWSIRSRALAILIACVWLGLAASAQPLLIPAQGYAVARDGTRIYYEIAGSGNDTVVVSGGFMLREALAPLTQHARVVFYDARGRGRSDAVPAERVSARHQVTDLEDLRIALGLERFVLLGFSGMGKELFGYLAEHPERVERMLQVGPVPPVPGDFVEEMMQTRIARVDEDKLAEFRRRREAGTWDDDPAGYCRAEAEVANVMTFADPAHAVAYPDVCQWPNEWPANLNGLYDTLLPSLDAVDPTEAIKTSTVPRLVLIGTEDAITPARARAWIANAPNACLREIDGAAHWPFVERPEQFWPLALRFIAGADCAELDTEQ